MTPPLPARLFLPRPYQLTMKPGVFRPGPVPSLTISGYGKNPEPVVQLFKLAGLSPRRQEISTGGQPYLILGEAQPLAQKKLRAELSSFLAGISQARIRDQVYVLEVSEKGALALAGGEAGLFYAAVTLSHLVSPGGEIPWVVVQDRPALALRAVLLDVSRGRVPKLSALKELVDLLALLKFNQLTFNLEHTFASAKHPAISAGHDPLTPAELAALSEYARERHLEIIPFQQSLGHLHHLLSVPAYRHLAYHPQKLWSLDPAQPQSYDLLRDLYAEQIAVTSSEFLHVGCDEPFDLAKHFDPAHFSGRPLSRVIQDHLLKLHELVTSHGRKMMAWADTVVAHPEMLPHLPPDLILCHWLYGSGNLEGPEHYQPSLQLLGQSGLPFYACTTTWSFMKIFPDLAVMRKNHESFLPAAKKAGARGMMVTMWGDMGHMNLPGLEPYPLAYASRHAWEKEPEEMEFGPAFAWTVFRDPEGVAAKLAETLDQVNTWLWGPAGMAGVGFLLLFAEPLSTGLISRDPTKLKELAGQLSARGHEAAALLSQMEKRGLPRSPLWQDLSLPLQQIRVLAKKFELAALLHAHWDQALHATTSDPTLPEPSPLAQLVQTAAQLCEETAGLVAQTLRCLEERWLASSKSSDLSTNQERYHRLLAAWQARAKEFMRFAQNVQIGQAVPLLSRLLDQSPSGYSFNPLQEMGLFGLV